MSHPHSRTGATLCALGATAALALTLGACSGSGAGSGSGSGSGSGDPQSSGSATDQSGSAEPTNPADPATSHGQVEGAAELPEPALSLLTLSGSGAVDLVDLADLSRSTVTTLEGVRAVAGDGRFLVADVGGDGVALVDSGVWTVDHGDHQHYYRAPARAVGTVEGLSGAPLLSSGELLTVLTSGTTAVLLDREALGAGSVSELARTRVDEGSLAAPLGERWVAVREGAVEVLDEGGTATPGVTETCEGAAGGTTTRVGVVLSCAGGVVLATVAATDGAPALERVDLPAGTDAAARPHGFGSRPGRPTVAALDDTGGYWLLDTRERTWTHVDSEVPLVAVAAIDDRHDRVVAIDEEGRVLVWADGDLENSTEPIASPEGAARGLHVDTTRAYVPAGTPGQVLEIDVVDGARIARTIDTPDLVAVMEVGL